MNILLIIAGALALLVCIGWLGLQVKPRPFPVYAGAATPSQTLLLPAGLPAPVDDRTALLCVPYAAGQSKIPVRGETFVVRFEPETGLIEMMEAMRYREPGAGEPKILWITRNLPGPTLPGLRLRATGSATWLDQGRPWAVMTLETIVTNADVRAYIRARGQ
jgi:hypothetical protein